MVGLRIFFTCCLLLTVAPAAVSPPIDLSFPHPVQRQPQPRAGNYDVTGDGRRDLVSVTTDGLTITIAVEVAAPESGFSAPVSSIVARNTYSYNGVHLEQVVDLNKDNSPDVIFGIRGGSFSEPFISLNQGGGSFGTATAAAADGWVSYATPVDLDGDGHPEFVTDNNFPLGPYPPTALLILRPRGDGTFDRDFYPSPAPEFGPGYAVASDIDSDGIVDVACPGGIIRGIGDARFAPMRLFPGGRVGTSLFASDMDNDGDQDFFLGCPYPYSSYLTMFRNDAGHLTEVRNYDVARYSFDAPTMLDLNRNGIKDLVVKADAGLCIYMDAVRGGPGACYSFPAAADVGHGDLNNDGIEDFYAISNSYAPPSPFLLSSGPVSYQQASERYPLQITGVTDWDRDGVADVFASTVPPARDVVAVGTGGGRLAAPVFIDWPFSAARRAFGNTGAVLQPAPGGVSTYFVRSNGNVDPAAGATVPGAGQQVPQAIDVGDLDSDGLVDLVVGLGNRVFQFPHWVWPQAFGPPTLLYTSGTRVQQLIVGDFDEDGRRDILSYDGNALTPLRNETIGPFLFSVHPPVVAPGFTELAPVDLDGDGALDLVAHGAGTLVYLLNRGGFQFVSGPTLVLPAGAGKMEVHDLNRDGTPDVLVQCGTSLCSILHGQGAPRLHQQIDGVGVWDAADFDRDGAADLFVGYRDAVAVWRNLGAGTFQRQQEDYLLSTRDVVAVDANRDGRFDVVTSDLLFLNRTAWTTGVAVMDWRVQATAAGIVLSWRVAEDGNGSGRIGVQRAAGDGPFVEIASKPAQRDIAMQYLDSNPPPGSISYRLLLAGTGGSEFATETIVTSRIPSSLHFDSVESVPAERTIVFRYSGAPPASAVRTAIYDVAGRLVRALPPSLPSTGGIMVSRWDGANAGGAAAARGVYWVQVEAPGQRAARRFEKLWR